MTFLVAVLALLIEQLRPLPSGHALERAVVRFIFWVRRHGDAGQRRHAAGVWSVCVALPALAVALLFWGLWSLNPVLGFAWDVAVLYVCLGFRQFSHRFTAIRESLQQGDEPRAWELLALWQQRPGVRGSRAELVRQVMVLGLLSAHRHVFGVFFWFVALSALGLGPAGAVLYRLAEHMRRLPKPDPAISAFETGYLAEMARSAFARIDHLPARLTAASFAIAGNFEEAVNRWRRDAALWDDDNEGVILAAAEGAAGLRLAPAAAAEVPQDQDVPQDSPAGPSTPTVESAESALRSLVGLVWRSLVLSVLLVALLSLANVLG